MCTLRRLICFTWSCSAESYFADSQKTYLCSEKKKGNKNMSKRNLKTPPILKPKSNGIVFKSANYKTSTGGKKNITQQHKDRAEMLSKG